MATKIFLLTFIIIVVILVIVMGSLEYFVKEEAYIPDFGYEVSVVDIEDNFKVELVTEASFASDIDFLPDGTILYSELMSGNVMSYKNGQKQVYANVPNALTPTEPEGESGILSLVTDPRFEENGWVYVYYTSEGTSKIGRFKDVNGKGEDFKIIFDGVPQGKIHNGGELVFGLDDKLYLSTGDATQIKGPNANRKKVQDISSFTGKILRMNRDGSIPDDNPFESSYTYVLGFRNMFGFDFHENGKIYGADNGVACCDEFNIIEKGRNYGWPEEIGYLEEEKYDNPVFIWSPKGRVAPTRTEIYTGDKYPEEYKGDVYMTTWRTREVIRFELDDDGDIERIEVMSFYHIPDTPPKPSITGKHINEVHGSKHPYGGLVEIEQGPDGYFYISDSRRIFRIVYKG